ncbi:MAG: type III-B CRISPR module RAMP protein Cmr4 [Gammaproteobacteria bacterium]|nr:type III-B CRISPR module RAMP protein Cmr4 [Gammaproteobacteria bacterium]
MNTAMLGLLAETPIHPGTGRGRGVVDLPVAREAATDYPVLVGSSLKGALKDKSNPEQREGPFGTPDHAGALLVSDARLLLLPVRSLTGTYRWATCPHLVERYRRDLSRAGLGPRPSMPYVDRHQTLAAGDDHLFLEERQFCIQGTPADDIADSIRPLLLHPETQKRLSHQVAILDDDDFSWFARYGLPIQARNKLADDTKRSQNLWYEESLPPDRVMYALVMARDGMATNPLELLFSRDPYLQAGGNETVGHGWFAVSVRRAATEKTR